VVLTRDVAQDEKLFMDDIVYDPGRPDYRLYSLATNVSSSITGGSLL
jgi:hypothetical protein